MNGKCADDKGRLKSCPFRIATRESKTVYGKFGEDSFMRCIGEECVAYHVGYCLRLAGETRYIQR